MIQRISRDSASVGVAITAMLFEWFAGNRVVVVNFTSKHVGDRKNARRENGRKKQLSPHDAA